MINSEDLYLNVLLDLARYYRIKRPTKKLTYNEIQHYLLNLQEVIKFYPPYSKIKTQARATILESAIEKMHKKSYTFNTLCIAYFMIRNGSPCLVEKAEAFSRYMCRRLGTSTIEKSKSFNKNKYLVNKIAE